MAQSNSEVKGILISLLRKSKGNGKCCSCQSYLF